MKLKKTLPVKLIFVLLGLVVLYFFVSIHYQKVFLPHTTYSGVNISGKTPEAANQLLKQRLAQQRYTIKEHNQTITTFTGKDLDIRHNYAQQLKALQTAQNPWAWSITTFAASDTDTVTTTELKLNTDKVQDLYEDILAKVKDDRTATKNATLTKKDGQFTITKEVYGTEIDEAKLKKVITQSIDTGQTTIDLKQAYKTPTVLSDDARLQKDLSTLNTIQNETITYKIFGDTFKVPAKEIHTWLTYQDGEIQTDEAAVKAYVQTLSNKYSTINKARKFKATGGTTITVPAGTYGWSLKTTSEAQALAKEVLKGKDFTRTPLTQGFNYNNTGTDIGSTYVEVSKSAQHMWVYKNGDLIISTDVVTGKPGQDTPSGTFVVWNKERNTSLKGTNDDGSAYDSPVSYWMPIDYTGVGLHDSSWQPTYGGSWYLQHGSHGCVNTPPSVMRKVYENIDVNTPVLVY